MKKEITLGLLVVGEEALISIRSVKNIDGADIMGIRRTVKSLFEEIEEYKALRLEKIKELGTIVGDQVTIKTTDKTYPEYNSFINNLMNSKITIDIKRQIETVVIENLKPCPLSGEEIDILVAIGILVEPEEPKVEKAKPAAEPVVVPESSSTLPPVESVIEDGEVTEVK